MSFVTQSHIYRLKYIEWNLIKVSNPEKHI